MIIGFGHQRGVGKDTATAIMSTQLKINRTDLSILNIAFADPLYEICHKLYGWAGMRDKEYYLKHLVEKETVLPAIGKSPRQLLIDMGTPAVRNQVWDQTWVQYAMNRKADVVFISDVRFPNEAQAIRDSGGILIKLVRPSMPTIDDPNDPDNKLSDWTDWDKVLINEGTIQEFAKLIQQNIPTCL